MWTQIMKSRYAQNNWHNMEEGEQFIFSMAKFTRKEVREKRRLWEAMADERISRKPQFGKSYYNKLNAIMANARVRTESVHHNKIVIYGIEDATYLNGLHGILEDKIAEGYVIRLDENNVVADTYILLNESEFAFRFGNPIFAEAEENEKEEVQKYRDRVVNEINEELDKQDVINLIADFTGEYPYWN